MKEYWEVEGPRIVEPAVVANQRCNGKQPLTYSIMRTGLTCPRMMYWKYYKGFRVAPSDNMLIGSAFHYGMEKQDPIEASRYYMYHRTGFIGDDVTIKNNMLFFMVRGAMARWNYDYKEIRPEQTFKLNLINPDTGRKSQLFYWAGKIDAVGKTTDDQWYLIERKTTGQNLSHLFDMLYLDHQLVGYIEASAQTHDVDLRGVDYQVVRKPSIRQRQTESVMDYVRRMDTDYTERPEFYFHRKIVPISHIDTLSFLRNIWEVGQLFHWYEKTDNWPMNTNQCDVYGGCPYISLCSGVTDAEYTYTVDFRRAPELEEENIVTNGEECALS